MSIPQGDVAVGEKLYKARCIQCHTIDKEPPGNKIGPNLYGVFGRKAGTLPGYNYTQAMQQSEIVWEEGTLYDYLLHPKAKIPGTKMVFPGLKSEKYRADVIAYLQQAAPIMKTTL